MRERNKVLCGRRAGSVGLLLFGMIVLSACNDQSGSERSNSAVDATEVTSTATIAPPVDDPRLPGLLRTISTTTWLRLNPFWFHPTAPMIAGSPSPTVLSGARYNFQPMVMDGSADVGFSIKNKPAWATFNTSTGMLSGVPTASDIGTYGQIVITVSNGRESATLPPFSITVQPNGIGSVTVSWIPPTTNSNGYPITNLAGYEISYGTKPSALTQTLDVRGAGLTEYVINNLTPGTWYFAIQSYNASGVASALSPVVEVTVGAT
jgi:hypothetical protein